MNLVPGITPHRPRYPPRIALWLADNVEMQADPAIVAHLPNGYQLTQADCIEVIDVLLHQLRD